MRFCDYNINMTTMGKEACLNELRISNEEFEVLTKCQPEVRYQYTLKRIADTETMWSIMKKWIIITGLIILSVISYWFIDSRIIDYTDGTPVKYMELPKEVQDSLVWRGRHDGNLKGYTISPSQWSPLEIRFMFHQNIILTPVAE